jgi:hypothetical protein
MRPSKLVAVEAAQEGDQPWLRRAAEKQVYRAARKAQAYRSQPRDRTPDVCALLQEPSCQVRRAQKMRGCSACWERYRGQITGLTARLARLASAMSSFTASEIDVSGGGNLPWPIRKLKEFTRRLL